MNNKGFTLVELACALAVLSIIIIPFTGLFSFFSEINHTSRITYRSGIAGQNLLESLKGKSLTDLFEFMEDPAFPDNEFRYEIKAEGYMADTGGSNCCDIIIKKDQGILSYILYPAAEPLFFEPDPSSTGLSLTIISEDGALSFHYEDSAGITSDYYIRDTCEISRINLYINEKPNDYPVSFAFEGFNDAFPAIRLFDDLFSCRDVKLCISGNEYSPENGYPNDEERDLPFTCIYAPDDIYLYVTAEVLVYDWQDDGLPVNRRKGILKVKQ